MELKKPSFITAFLKMYLILFVENCYCVVSVYIKHLIRGCDFDCRFLHLEFCCPKWYWNNSPITLSFPVSIILPVLLTHILSFPISIILPLLLTHIYSSRQYHSASAADSYLFFPSVSFCQCCWLIFHRPLSVSFCQCCLLIFHLLLSVLFCQICWLLFQLPLSISFWLCCLLIFCLPLSVSFC